MITAPLFKNSYHIPNIVCVAISKGKTNERMDKKCKKEFSALSWC